jgi:hypothetical protein
MNIISALRSIDSENMDVTYSLWLVLRLYEKIEKLKFLEERRYADS